MHGAAANGKIDAMEHLLQLGGGKHGDTVAVADFEGSTPIHAAAASGESEAVRFCVTHGADVNQTDGEGRTPLYVASEQGHVEACRALEELGADPTIKSLKGLSAVAVAGQAGQVGTIEAYIATSKAKGGKFDDELKLAIALANAYKQQAVVDLLIAAGFDPNAPDVQMVTPLHRAAGEGDTDTIKELLETGAQVGVKDLEGMTPIFFAVRGGHLEVAKFLVESNADLDEKRNDGRTVLAMAIEQNKSKDTALVTKLLAMGCEPSTTDVRGITPLHLAVAKGDPGGEAIARMLAEAGADLNACRSDSRSVLHQALAAPSVDKADTFLAMLELKANPNIKSSGETCLHFVAAEGRIEEAKLLRKFKANGGESDGNGAGALSRAASAGHTAMVDYLLGFHGVDINAQDSQGGTALIEATKANHIAVVKKLVEGKAETELVDAVQKTAFMWASDKGFNEIVELLAPVANIDMKGKGGWTSLYSAAFHNKMDMVKLLIQRGADAKEANDDGWAPLHAAAYSGSADMVSALLEGGAVADVADKQGTTPLLQACTGKEEGHQGVVTALVGHKVDLDQALPNGWTPLHAAAWGGRTAIVDSLLAAKADAKKFTAQGVTPLLSACGAGNIPAMKSLAATGVALDAKDPERGRFPLYYAARLPNLEVATTLIQAKASVGDLTNNKRTALHKAARRGHIQLVKYLLDSKSDVSLQDERGDSPLHLAPGNINIVKVLLDAGSPLNVQGHVGWSPLFRFVSIGSKEIVQLIVERGGDVHLANCVGDVPLHMAASDDSVELVRLLVEKKTDINHKGFVSRTPLHSAAAAGQLNAIRTLVELKADVHAKDSKGATAVDYAQKKGFAEAGALIAEHLGVAFDASKTQEQQAAAPLILNSQSQTKSSNLGMHIARPPTPPDM